MPWLLVGAGGLALAGGAYFLASAPSLPAGCNADTNLCAPVPGESPGDTVARQDDAASSKNQPVYGAIAIAGGGALVVSGLVWHFLEGPRGSAARHEAHEARAAHEARLTPVVGPHGIGFQGAFAF